MYIIIYNFKKIYEGNERFKNNYLRVKERESGGLRVAKLL